MINKDIKDLYYSLDLYDEGSLYSVIKEEIDGTEFTFNPDHIEEIYQKQPPGLGGVIKFDIKWLFPSFNIEPEDNTSLISICLFYLRRYQNTITESIKLNSQLSEALFDIIQIIAPAIAQQYSGLPAMAIVAGLTVLLRKQYIK
jgi:hypothetical protein